MLFYNLNMVKNEYQLLKVISIDFFFNILFIHMFFTGKKIGFKKKILVLEEKIQGSKN